MEALKKYKSFGKLVRLIEVRWREREREREREIEISLYYRTAIFVRVFPFLAS